MGGSSPSKTTTTTKTELPAYVQPYAKDLMTQGANVANRPYEAYQGQRIAELDPYQIAGLDMTAQRALAGSPVTNAAQQNMAQTLSGGFMGANPYLDQMFGTSAQRITDAYRTGTAAQTDAAASRAKALGGSAYNELTAMNNRALGDSLSALSAQTYGQNYEAERQRQMQAAQMAPQLAEQDYRDASALIGAGDAYRQYQQDLLNQGYGDWLQQYNYPLSQLDIMGQTIASASGGQGTSTASAPNPYKSSPLSGAIGGAMAGSAFGPWGAAAGGALGLLGGI